MNLDILFLATLFPKGKEKEIKQKMRSGMFDAANGLQWNIINGLDDNDCGTIKIVNDLPVNSFPRGYADGHIEEYVFQHTSKYDSDDITVGCTNVTIIKQFLKKRPFQRVVRKWVKDGSGRKKVLLSYTASTMFLSLAKYAKSIDPSILTCCMIADLPEFSAAKTLHGLRKRYYDYQGKKAKQLCGCIDRFVLLTDQMAQRLDLTVPYVVVEGVAPDPDVSVDMSLYAQLEGTKYILYTGTLNYAFGIGTLLAAFEKIHDPDLKLVICGFGEAEKAIIESQDTRVIFLGKVDRSQALALQRGAAVLVNPRQNNEAFTKYSFPSKTMEYLASGVPVVAYKLDGIPDEYDEYLNYVPDHTPEALAEAISELCRMPEDERRKMGARAKSFVLKEKNRAAQTAKILELLDRV